MSPSRARFTAGIQRTRLRKSRHRVEEYLDGYQIFWSRFIGILNVSEKIVKYL